MLNLSTPSAVNGASVTDFGKQRFETWNSIAQEQAGAVSVVQLVTRQAELSPQASAVTHGAMSLSYGELNERANQLAHLLQSLGVGPDYGCVGIGDHEGRRSVSSN